MLGRLPGGGSQRGMFRCKRAGEVPRKGCSSLNGYSGRGEGTLGEEGVGVTHGEGERVFQQMECNREETSSEALFSFG